MKRIITTLALLLALAVPAFGQEYGGGLNYSRWQFFEEFIGGGTLSTSASADSAWVITDTSSSGTPTYERVDLSESGGTYMNGVCRLKFDNTNEVQNVALSFGNKLALDWDKLYGIEFRLRIVGEAGSAKDAATTISFGLVSDRADDLTGTTAHALFRLDAASTSMALTLDTDDGSTDTSDIATSVTVTDSAWYRYRILFTSGTDDIRFYAVNANSNVSASLARQASAQTFDASAYTGACQPIIQIQKSADTNVDSVECDYLDIWGTR